MQLKIKYTRDSYNLALIILVKERERERERRNNISTVFKLQEFQRGCICYLYCKMMIKNELILIINKIFFTNIQN